MKIPIEWLKEFVLIPWSQEVLAHRLSMAGFEVEGDEVNITPNRGDALSILGLAREIGALQGKPLKFKKTPSPKGERPIGDFIQVQVIDKRGCPRYMARAVLGVTIRPSPAWMQKRLEEAGLRPINNVVDCTNYVLWELGHPLHAFDQRFLRNKKIIVRRENSPTRFTTLDGEIRVCEPADLFICDSQGPVALAGILGGANSEVRNDTKDIVIEAAVFDPKRIHATAKRLKISTESSTRFERGVDLNGVENALHRVVELIVETAGGEPTKDWIDIYPEKIKPAQITLAAKEIERILGVKIPSTKIKQLLLGLGFSVRGGGGSFKVLVPTFRGDIARPIDLIEELARLFGYENIPETMPQIGIGLQEIPKESHCFEETIDCLRACGFSQGCGLSFCSMEEALIFAKEEERIVSLSNPLSVDQAVLRPSLLPGLLRAVAFNAHRQVKGLKLFELAKVFSWKEGGVAEKRKLGLVGFGLEWPPQWQIKTREVDFYSLKGALNQLTNSLRISPFQYERENHASAKIFFEGGEVGWIGLIDPGLLKIWDIKIPVWTSELDWEILAKHSEGVQSQCKPPSKFPLVERDIALVLDQDLAAQKIEEAIWKAGVDWIQKVRLFDLYQGEELGPGKKSLALNICYGSPERTLTNEEVAQVHASLVAHLEKTFSAKLR